MARKSRKPTNLQTILPIKEKKVAIYTRLSRDDKQKKGDSLENQKHIALEHLLTIPELGVPVLYEDSGFTGRNTNRPQFKKMIEDIEQKQIEAVIVKDLSRFSRNSIDSGYYLDKFFPLHGVRFIAVNDLIDSASDDAETEGAIIPIKTMLNEAYSLDLGKKIKSVKGKSMRDGEYVASLAPYGYRKSKDNHFKLEIDEVSSKVVLEIFKRTLQGEKIGTIVRTFNDRLELSPLDYHDFKKGKIITEENARVWGNHSIEKILTSEVYIGNLVQGRFENIDRIAHKTEESAWIKTENTHDPLISKEVFEQVQKIVAANKKPTPRKTHKPNVYVNKLFCGHCGKPMARCTLHRKDGTYFKYKCKSNYLIRKNFCEVGFDNIIWEDELNEEIVNAIETCVAIEMGKTLDVMIKEKESTSKKKKQQGQLKVLEKEISQKQAYLKGLYESLVKGILSKKDYVELKNNYEVEIKDKKTEYNEITKSILLLEEKIKEIQGYRFLNVTTDLEITPELLDCLVEKILIYGNDTTEVVFKFKDIFLDTLNEKERKGDKNGKS